MHSQKIKERLINDAKNHLSIAKNLSAKSMKSHHLEFCKSFLSCHGDYDDLVLQIDNLIYQLDYSKGRVTNLLISKINALKI